MARPRKQTVDYFPHQCIHGKTMFILEQKYGNDGYAFWFKLLEMLGAAEGHYLHFQNGQDWEFLKAKTRLDSETCEEVLNLLASLEAIDKDLWLENRVVWSDNFLNNIADAYRNRTVEIPGKPNNLCKKSISNGQSYVRNPQMKEDETREDETRLDEIREGGKPPPAPHQKIVDLYNSICKTMPQVRNITEKRKKKIRVIWGEKPDIKIFETIFRKASESDFLSGRNGKWDGCSFDWLINYNNAVKVLEGNYDNKKQSGPPAWSTIKEWYEEGVIKDEQAGVHQDHSLFNGSN